MIIKDLTDDQILNLVFLYPDINFKRSNFLGLKEVVCDDELQNWVIILDEKKYVAVYSIDTEYCYLMVNTAASLNDFSIDYVNDNSLRVECIKHQGHMMRNYFEVIVC